MQEPIKDIHKRIYNFVIQVLKLIKELPKTPENIVIIYQITKSVTSMGANDQEADGTITINDFIHKYSIVRKEGKETNYWLRVIADTNDPFKTKLESIINESEEIIKIVSSIIYNTQRKLKK